VIIGDGAAALVVVSEAFARRIGKRSVRVAASRLVSGDRDLDSPVSRAAAKAYEQAGLGPSDVHVVEVHDAAAPAELFCFEELGLCPEGGAIALLRDGQTGPGGRIPVNPSGGLLSKGEPLGASALGQIVELTWQLRGTAGTRQVDGARVALAHTVGRGANACVVILTR